MEARDRQFEESVEEVGAEGQIVMQAGILGLKTFLAIAMAVACAGVARADERIGPASTDARNPIVKIFEGKRLDLWSLKPVQRPALPQVANPQQAKNAIDRFILARLEKEQLAPAKQADKRTLARRLYFDLTGLPPTPDEMRRFVEDQRPDAYERLVDELLASPRYGEQMARLWLDVVRYSDSNGFDWDEFRPRAWLFRDYVIRSLNADKPYDRFLIEQLAGDELLSGPPRDAAEQDALIATTYLRLGPQDNSAALFNEQSRMRHEWLVDVVETTSSAMLALTMSCCRCHDHKYDPLSQVDHYRFRAFFEPLRYADDTAIELASEQDAIRQQHAQLEGQKQPIEEQLRRLRDAVKPRVKEERRQKLDPKEQGILAIVPEHRSDEQKEVAKDIEDKIAVSDEDANQAMNDEEKQQREAFEKQLSELEQRKRKFTHALLATDGNAGETKLLHQGDHKQPRETVPPGFISALDPNPAAIEKPAKSGTQGRRLALAKWIASPENPFTARVMVNRLWQHHFGQGLVATPNDFGLGGATPTHPELLDYLASEFVERGWSIKSLQREIVFSATYRQASTISPGNPRDSKNQLLARQNLRRLTAEQLRDSLLVVSGLLNEKHSGPPIWPELPTDVLQANPAFLDDNATKTKGWYPSPPQEQDARSIVLVQKKTVRVPFMETFDLPENSLSCGRRNVSTVAPQALTLLNSPLAVKATKALAERVQKQAGDDPAAQINAAFQFALQRAPTDREREVCGTLLSQRGLVAVCRALLNVNEFAYVD
jgi:hypothetical protein